MCHMYATYITSYSHEFKTKFEPVSLQTQIHPNVQTNVQFKISKIRNRSNSQNTKNDQIWTKKIS